MFFRIFGFCGLFFGFFQAVLVLAQGGPPGKAIGVGVVAGLFFGLSMAVVLSAMHRWGMKKRGFDPGSSDSSVDVRERITLPLASDQALALCRSAVEQVPKARGVRVNAESATLAARVGMSWASFGEHIECRVQPGDGGSTLEIRSRPALRTTIVDYGKNRENVERIRAVLTGSAPGDTLSPA
jgi:hypothetical protein